MRTILAVLASAALATLASCGGQQARPDDTLRIAASIPPLEWVARGLALDGAPVTTLLPPGASEHGYEPPPSRLAAFVRADVVLLVGLGLDDSVARALANTSRDGRAIVVFAEVTDLEAPSHEHVDESDHSHAHPADPHLWLDPPRMADLVRAAHDAVAARVPPDKHPALAARRDALLAEVARVDADHRARLAPFRGAAIVAAHDSISRLAERYGLRVVGTVHSHEGGEPTPGDIARAAQGLRGAPHRAILVEPQSARAIADRLARETGAPVAEFDTLGRGDWPATLRANLDALTSALAASAETPAGR